MEAETKISEKKRKEVEDVKRLIKEYKVMGIVNLESLPAFNLMKIKSQLKGDLVLKYSKKRLMKIAFDKSGDKNIQSLKDKLEGIPALVFTNEDPFRLFQLLKKSKSPASARPGDIAPKDIYVQAGPTDFSPGPMIGELGQLGIKTSVEGGKVSIKENKLLVKEGEEIDTKNAGLMAKLKIEPMEIGLNLLLTYGNNEILVRSVLDIDIDQYFENIRLASGESLNLAGFVGYISDETIELLVRKAAMESEALSGQVGIGEESMEGETKTTEKQTFEEKEKETPEKIIEESVEEQVEEEEPLEQPQGDTEEEKKTNLEQSSFERSVGKERKTPLEEEMEQEPEEEKVSEDPEDKVKIEQKDPQDTSEEAMRKAEENLKNIINKKLKGEI